jgi:hypothetical protein
MLQSCLTILLNLYFASSLANLCLHLALQYLPALLAILLRPFTHNEFVFDMVPWVGIYLVPQEEARKEAVRTFGMGWAIAKMLFCMGAVSYFIGGTLVSYMHTGRPGHHTYHMMPLLLGIEMFSICFVRTQLGLIYFPKVVFLMLFAFNYYLDIVPGCYAATAFMLLVVLCLLAGLVMLIWLEQPALAWDQASLSTPCLVRPRTRFVACFSESWLYEQPSWWSIFLPLKNSRNFEEQEMVQVR